MPNSRAESEIQRDAPMAGKSRSVSANLESHADLMPRARGWTEWAQIGVPWVDLDLPKTDV